MRKIFIISALLIASISNAQDKKTFGRIPDFLIHSADGEFERVFESKLFVRFSSTLPQGIVIAYENSSNSKIGSMGNIKDQIFLLRSKLSEAKNETPVIEFFQWADYIERTEIYPCGLVAIFKDEKLTHVWMDLK